MKVLVKKIYRIGFVPVIILTIGLIISGLISYIQIQEFSAYRKNYVLKQKLMEKLHFSFGYGGGIHNFKNYVLRGFDEYRNQSEKNLLKSLKLIGQIKAIEKVESKELKAFSDIENTIKEYLEKLPVARDLISKKTLISYIDKQVKVDDTKAILGLKFLEQRLESKNKIFLKRQERITKTTFANYVISLLLSIVCYLYVSRLTKKDLIKSIKMLFEISDDLKDGKIKEYSLNELPDDGLKKLALQLNQLGVELNSTIESLKDSNESLQDFAYVAAHDIQGPAKKIYNYIELLEMQLEFNDTEKIKHSMNEIKKSSEFMINLIRGILKISVVEKRDVKLERIDLFKFLEDIKNDELRNHSELDIKLLDLPSVLVEPSLLRSYFQNLISNSFKYKKENEPCQIEIYGEDLGDSLILNLKDNGIGIGEEQINDVVKAFHRSDKSKRVQGLGLGLYQCARIAESHGTKLEITSKLGEGTTFSIKLKKADA